MPPPMPNPSKRITANPVRPARYRPGKAVPEDESSEEEDEEEIEQPRKPATKPQPRAQPQRSRQSKQDEEDDDEDDEDGFVTEEEDETPAVTQTKTPDPNQITTTTQRIVQPQISQPQPVPTAQSDDEESEEEESSEESEQESSSEEEAPQRKFQRPTFIKREDRQKPQDPTEITPQPSITAATSTPEVDEQTRRLAQADLYIKDKLERDALARAQGRKAWDDDEELDPEAQVDDTDGLDPAAEHAAWKLRELKRLKRDREAIEAREKEIEEIERRRNLTKEERDAEDREYIERQKEDREQGRGKAGFLAKYHHKGAFFQDDETVEVLQKRDLVGARFEDDVDKSSLPEYMRIRDMTKLGKKGRTRYTDLRNEDTGRFGENVKRWKGSGYETRDGQDGGVNSDLRGVDERFLPDQDGDRGRDARGPTGANASAVGQRREGRYSGRARSRSKSRSPRRRGDDRGDTYRPRRRSYSYSRSRSRSRTPPRRKRSPSPYRERDKRRRIDVD